MFCVIGEAGSLYFSKTPLFVFVTYRILHGGAKIWILFSSGKTVFYERAQRVSKILFLQREILYRQKDIDKIMDFYSPKRNCDCSNLQYSDIRHCLQ